MLLTHWRRAALGVVALSLVVSACRYTGFGDPGARSTAASATTWLKTQQQADGSFEVAGFPGFETPDAILAIAEDAQAQAKWDATQARQAVATVKTGGRSALDAIDDFTEGTLSGGQAAKLIVLVAGPLGYDPYAFNPQGDATTTNLIAPILLAYRPDGSFGAFNATLYAALASKVVGSTTPTATVALVRAGQQPDGGWNFAGDQSTETPTDVDTTSLAIQALIAAGVQPSDPVVRKGLAYLANGQQASGAWQSFGADDPNSTASAIFALTAVGYDVNARCWRDQFAPGRAGSAYASPTAWLAAQQAPDGHIESPNDAFPPVTTFATTQSIEALRRGWLPVTVSGFHVC